MFEFYFYLDVTFVHVAEKMQYELSVSRPSPLIDLFKGTCFHTPVASRRSFRSRCSLAGSALTCTLSQSVKWKLMLKFERTFTITRFDGPLCGSLYSNSQWHGRDPSLLSGLGCPKPGQNPRAPCVSNHVLISPCDSGHPGCRGCRCFCRAKKAGDCTRGVLRNFIQGHFPVPPSFPRPPFPRPPFPPPPVPAAFSPTFHSSPPCPPFRLRALSGVSDEHCSMRRRLDKTFQLSDRDT